MRGQKGWLVRHPSEWRQIGIVFVYWTLLGVMYTHEECRNFLFFGLACGFSFLNAVVLHNHMHQGIFHSKRLNGVWRVVLSFGCLYPASANIPAHNLVHHHFDDEGQPDWAAPENVQFRWNLLNLLHFPNIAGPNTFEGVTRWMKTTRMPGFRRRYLIDSLVPLVLMLILLGNDFWGALLFVLLPQLFGARWILRINLIQHDLADTRSRWNHSRNFVGRAFNWLMCNNGYHTIHHNRAGLHWSTLPQAHAREVLPHIDPRLDEPSMAWYLLRTYILHFGRSQRVWDG